MKLLSEDEVRAVYRQGEEAMVGLFMQLQEQLRMLTERVNELEARANKNSHNSDKPPSSDGYRKPTPKSLRHKTGRRSGGQAGHSGTTLEMVAQPDRVEAHWPEQCTGCGQPLGPETRCASASGYEARQVHDLPPMHIEVTEHRAMQVCCAQCGATTQAAFPEGVTPGAQYGSGVAALGVYAQAYQLLPLERTRELLGDVVKCRPSEGTLVNMLAACDQRVAAINAQIKAAIGCAEVVHFDETGMRVAGKLHWLHTASTQTLTYYAVDAKRGKLAHDRIGILPMYRGVAVHDALSSYLRYPGYAGTHGLCNSHLLRELTALQEVSRQRWPTGLKTLLVEMKTCVARAVEHGHTHLRCDVQTRLEAAYDRLVKRALQANPRPKYLLGQRGRPRASPARNLAERLRDHKDSVLRFLRDFRVPFDNNLAERDLRMMKVKQKISGCFRSERGAHMFAAVRGYISTVRKQGFAALAALRALFDGHPVALHLA
jgi:transposase